MSRRQLQGKTWRRLFSGVYVLGTTPLDTRTRIRALRLALPEDGIVTGLTAAWAYGLWEPAPGRDLTLEVAVDPSRRWNDGRDRARRLELLPHEINDLRGLPIVSPLRLCFDLIRYLPKESTVSWPRGMSDADLVEGTVWVDAFLRSGFVSAERLLQYAVERPHWPGVRRVKLACELATGRTWSPMESRQNTLLLLGGFPQPLLNVAVYHADHGLLGVPDALLIYCEPWVGIEYDGAFHRERDQHERDLARENLLVCGGDVRMLRYGHGLISNPDGFLSEVSNASGLPFHSLFLPQACRDAFFRPRDISANDLPDDADPAASLAPADAACEAVPASPPDDRSGADAAATEQSLQPAPPTADLG